VAIEEITLKISEEGDLIKAVGASLRAMKKKV
jgi:hypothetical protein